MLRIGQESRLSPAQVVEKAVAFFGPGGLGLEVKDPCGDSVSFEGGGGYVTVSACKTEKGSKGSDVDIETREWEYQVKEFLGKI